MDKFCYVYLFFIAILVFSNGMIFGMLPPFKPLNWVEREILLKTVKHAELESMLEESPQGPSLQEANGDATSYIEKCPYPFEVKLKLYCKSPSDVLTKIIFEAIALKEQKHASVVEEVKVGRAKNLNQPDNYIGAYTRYWYETDQRGLYISCISTFTDKAVLAEALASFDIKKILEAILARVQHSGI